MSSAPFHNGNNSNADPDWELREQQQQQQDDDEVLRPFHRSPFWNWKCVGIGILCVAAIAMVLFAIVSLTQKGNEELVIAEYSSAPTDSPTTLSPTASPTVPFPTQAPTLYKPFTSRTELVDAIRDYVLVLQESTNTSGSDDTNTTLNSTTLVETSPVALTYGYPMNAWDVRRVTDFSYLFSSWEVVRDFNEDVSGWDTRHVTSLAYAFQNLHRFNQPLQDWNVSSVTNMEYAFAGATAFNQPLDQWDVSAVVDMSHLFVDAQSFNQPIGQWHVSSVTTMEQIFWHAYEFNQPLQDWDVSSVVDLQQAFWNAQSFNQPLDEWQLDQGKFLQFMFYNATAFNQTLCPWGAYEPFVDNNPVLTNAFRGTACPSDADPNLDGTSSFLGPFCYSCGV